MPLPPAQPGPPSSWWEGTLETINSKLISWASILDEKTRAQAIATSTLPFIYPHLALMPDAHLGKGATVGSVIPTLRAIIPAAVGVDIGCGMIAVRTQYSLQDLPKDRETAARGDRAGHPVVRRPQQPDRSWPPPNRGLPSSRAGAKAGFNPAQYLAKWSSSSAPWAPGTTSSRSPPTKRTPSGCSCTPVPAASATRSRSITSASPQQINRKRDQAARPGPRLPREGTPEFDRYIRELRWAQHFALLNREEMMDRVVTQFGRWVGRPGHGARADQLPPQLHPAGDALRQVVWVSPQGGHRGRARRSRTDSRIHGDGVVRRGGPGQPVSLNSSPHGAGREYSRTAARKTFTLAELKTAMPGIEFRATEAFIDEIPAAYKPIDQVMRDAADLVKVRHKLRQLVNVKGD